VQREYERDVVSQKLGGRRQKTGDEDPTLIRQRVALPSRWKSPKGRTKKSAESGTAQNVRRLMIDCHGGEQIARKPPISGERALAAASSEALADLPFFRRAIPVDRLLGSSGSLADGGTRWQSWRDRLRRSADALRASLQELLNRAERNA
jgi:hypothetical protein